MSRPSPAPKQSFLLAVVLLLLTRFAADTLAQAIPERLADEQFWKISSESSEPDGTFRSDNLLSNELYFQYVIPDLLKTARSNRIYMGVGPEQNFTYIAALRPKMAFIVDIRRGNLDLHLMYKALFELSPDRADFVSMLFSKKRPAGLTSKSTVTEIFTAFADVETSETLYNRNLKAIENHLKSQHRFALSDDDISGIEYVYRNFYLFGPGINYSSSSGGGGFGGGMSRATYEELMTATDQDGQSRSYLANEDNFLFLKQLETKNLLVPVIGNFSGPKAIRAVAAYLKGLDAKVSAFYLSNVEDYLYRDGSWNNFCANVATLPVDETSTFIRSVRGGRYGRGYGGLNSDLGNIVREVKACVPGGN
jgi:hypothetical protein